MPLANRRPAPMFILLFSLAAAGCSTGDDLFCDQDGDCTFTKGEWLRIKDLAGIGPPPASLDTSNRWLTNEAAIQLGWKLYYSNALSGPARWRDMLDRPTESARSPRGEKMNLSCADCHDPARAGSDFTSKPGHVSEGAGWYDVNAQQTLNIGHYRILYWNGRSDSVWAQAAAVMESPVSMNGNRMQIVRAVFESHRAEYEALFGPMPELLPRAEYDALVEPAEPATAAGPAELGDVCKGATADACPAGCRAIEPSDGRCWPIYPLKGKPGRDATRCQPTRLLGMNERAEPHGDAFDCMAPENRLAINKAYANISKAIAAYEWELTSGNSPFDRYVAGERSALSPAAVRGLRLFVGRASCVDCHSGQLLSDSAFHNIGVPQRGQAVPTEPECVIEGVCDCRVVAPTPPNGPTTGDTPPMMTPVTKWPADTCLPWGYYYGLARLRTTTFRRDNPTFSDDPAAGRASHGDIYAIADAPAPATSAIGAWRTPSLRDVALTGPYMHNGIYKTLEEVIWHYDVGGTAEAPGKKAVELRPLLLTSQDRHDLAEFLRHLTGVPNRPELHERPRASAP